MYLQHCAGVFGVERVDIRKLPRILLRNGETHFRNFYFDALPYVPDDASLEQITRRDSKNGFFEWLKRQERIIVEQGVVRPKDTTCHVCGKSFKVPIQKLVDVKMSVRLVHLAWSETVSTIVLFAGDGDLLPAVKAVEDTRCTVRLAYVEEGDVRTSPALIKSCPEKMKLGRSQLEFCRLDEALSNSV